MGSWLSDFSISFFRPAVVLHLSQKAPRVLVVELNANFSFVPLNSAFSS